MQSIEKYAKRKEAGWFLAKSDGLMSARPQECGLHASVLMGLSRPPPWEPLPRPASL